MTRYGLFNIASNFFIRVSSLHTTLLEPEATHRMSECLDRGSLLKGPLVQEDVNGDATRRGAV